MVLDSSMWEVWLVILKVRIINLFFMFLYRLNTYDYYSHEEKYLPLLKYKKEV
jgi:hypothetical protein